MGEQCSCKGVLSLNSDNICSKCNKEKMIINNIPKKIISVPYGIASSYDDVIEINEKLINYPELREKILKHERMHRNGAYTKEDIRIDFQAEKPHFFESLKFAILNPEAVIGYFPIMYSYNFKKFTYNPTSALPFVYLGLIFSFFFWILFHINFFLAFLGWICIFTIINIILLITTHRYVKKMGN